MACNKSGSRKPCATQVCTLEFQSVVVKFVDKQGQPVVVQNYRAVNLTTGRAVSGAGAIDAVKKPGYYTVINDSSIEQLSGLGNDIQVTAVNPATNQSLTANFEISGGKCACHINKISGPEQVVFFE
ncbi:hypothetical protein [Mucilaginibacter lacusdianchii]|uniref:hypothetical protein n=1 Tax=Mucilaginibacter lacusdianchii TaxID=2684211 RepID=UPI00131C6D80|nr:hypothetical protein [Mucilaginibacter sp. JXJ CY 39]